MQTSDEFGPVAMGLEPVVNSARLRVAAAATEDVLTGGRELRQAFLAQPVRTAERGARLTAKSGQEPEVILLRAGFAFRSCGMPDGRRAILDVLTSGDLLGIDGIVAHAPDEFVAASRVSYRALSADKLRRLLADHRVALQLYSLLVEARWRAVRLAVSIGRLDAQSRISLFLLDIHDRLFRRGLIVRPTFNLPLTQEQIADHLGLTVVHVNRTLKRLREARLVLVDRQVVIIQDLPRLREMTDGIVQAPGTMASPADDASDRAGIAAEPPLALR